MNELFIMSREVMSAFSLDEMHATADALRELGLYQLPYENVDFDYPLTAHVNEIDYFWVRDDLKIDPRIRVTDLSVSGPLPRFEIISPAYNPITGTCSGKVETEPLRFGPNGLGTPADLRTRCCDMLITLLAVRNIKKTRTVDKLAKLGIGKNRKHRNVYSTTLSVPPVNEIETDPEHPPKPGHKVCPHLRRGHIRAQRHGPKNELIKRIWIAPVLVNADEEFVKRRAAYNVISNEL